MNQPLQLKRYFGMQLLQPCFARWLQKQMHNPMEMTGLNVRTACFQRDAISAVEAHRF